MTGNDNYFEDFKTGAVFRHARGKTVTVLENVLITNMVMNTAQAHFNEHMMRGTEHGGVVSFGGVQLSLVLGLSSQDCCENAIAELGLDRVRFASTARWRTGPRSMPSPRCWRPGTATGRTQASSFSGITDSTGTDGSSWKRSAGR